MVDLRFLRQSGKISGVQKVREENKMNLMSLTAVELGKKIRAKEVTVKEAVTEALDAIEKKEETLNSFVTVDREGALKRAEEVQKLIDDGMLCGPLAGVPVAIKDNMCTQGMLTTCSSKILYNSVMMAGITTLLILVYSSLLMIVSFAGFDV